MFNFHKKSFFIGIFLLLLYTKGSFLNAQETNNISNIDIEEFTNLILPPLDVLFENAKNAPNYEIAQVQEEIEKRILNKEKRAFLGFFSVRASWQYGTFANDGYLSSIIQEPVYSYTKADQTLYSVGASVNIPLDGLFDLGARIKRQKLVLKSTELAKELKYEEIKKEIIQLYTAATTQLNILKLRAESVVLANTQYAIIQRQFLNGTATSDLLATEKENQSVTMERFETIKSELTKNLMILEVITGTPILRK